MNIDPFKLATTAPAKILDGEILMTIVNAKSSIAVYSFIKRAV